MTTTPVSGEALIALAERVESAPSHELESICRELHAIHPTRNVNGTCASYLYDLRDAKRLIPKDHLYSICHDRNECRAVVALDLAERENGFSAVPHSPNAELRALVAAALRARASISQGT